MNHCENLTAAPLAFITQDDRPDRHRAARAMMGVQVRLSDPPLSRCHADDRSSSSHLVLSRPEGPCRRTHQRAAAAAEGACVPSACSERGSSTRPSGLLRMRWEGGKRSKRVTNVRFAKPCLDPLGLNRTHFSRFRYQVFHHRSPFERDDSQKTMARRIGWSWSKVVSKRAARSRVKP